MLLRIGDGSSRRTTSELDLYLPRTLPLDLSGMPTCRLDERLRPKGACTTLGRISDANFELAVNYPSADRSQRRFSVLPIKTESPTTGKKVLGFVFYSGIMPFSGYVFLDETTVKRVSGTYGQRLRIRLPRELVDSAGLDIYNALIAPAQAGLHGEDACAHRCDRLREAKAHLQGGAQVHRQHGYRRGHRHSDGHSALQEVGATQAGG